MAQLIDWDNRQWKEKENGDFIFDLKNITAKTFDVTAEKWSKVIANADRGVEKNQLRNFYDKVLELEEKAINADDNEFEKKVLPFIKMLNSKVTYAKNKQQGSVNEAFVIFMRESIAQIDSKESFANFRFLFEAVIGFYQKDKNVLKRDNTYNKNKRNNRGRR
jgi:CRISPR type III-A-associated protein Csm2